jgi:hypothetical protein
MRAVKIFLKLLLFAAGVFFGGWFFMPWKQVGEALLVSASRRLPAPASLSYSSVTSVAKNAPSGFTVRDLEVKGLMGMVDVSFGTLSITPDLWGSLLNMAPSCGVSFTGAVIGDISLTPLKKIPGVAPGSGRAHLSLNRQGVFVDGLRSDGEFSAAGSLLIDPSAMKIVWADVALDVKSEAFAENLSGLGAILPLRQDPSGRWSLRRQQGSDQ